MYLSTHHLVSISAAQIFLLAVVVGFTKPGSTIRTFSLPLTIGLMLFSVFSPKGTYDSILRVLIIAAPSELVLQHFNIAILRRWDFDFAKPQPRQAEKKQQKPCGQSSVWNRLKFGMYAAISHRYCGEAFEIENVPNFRRKDPKFVPSKRRFLVQRGLMLFAMYLVLDFLGTKADPDARDVRITRSRQALFSRLGDFTVREAIGRLLGTVMIWGCGILNITLNFGVPGWLLVIAGLSEPKWWRPVFNLEHGMPYSIRRFWSHFWHLSIKDALYQPARYVADDILHLRRGSLARRYTLIVLSFAISGLHHLVCDLAMGMPYQESGSMTFFLYQALAIMFEDFVSYIWKSLSRQSGDGKVAGGRPSVWQVCFGRIWVVFFLLWITPTWVFPQARFAGDNRTVPFSVVNYVKAIVESK